MQQDLIKPGHVYGGPNRNSIDRKVKFIGDPRHMDLEGCFGTWVEYAHVFYDTADGRPREGQSLRYAPFEQFARWCKRDVTPVTTA